MDKVSKKNLVGQPVFKQIINIIPKDKFDKLVIRMKTDRYYKTFFSWEQLVVMLFGIFSRCDSMGEVCDGMRALAGKLNYLGMDSSPAKSTAGDALRDRDEELFRLFYFALIAHFSPFLSVSRKRKRRKEGISFEEFYVFDPSTITLFPDIMKGVGRNPKGEGKKKGGLKVHMLTDIHADTPQFVKISEAKMHDKNFLQYLNLAPGSMIVFDKAYNYYPQYAKWTQTGVNYYQLVSTIRFQLERQGINHEWREIVRIMNTQKMVTTTLVNTDREHISIRKCSSPEPKVQDIYKALGYGQRPFIRKKSVVLQMKIEKNKKTVRQDFNST